MQDTIKVAEELGIIQQKSQFTFLLRHIYDMFLERDCEIVDINPLILTKENILCALNAKIKIDYNAMYRQ